MVIVPSMVHCDAWTPVWGGIRTPWHIPLYQCQLNSLSRHQISLMQVKCSGFLQLGEGGRKLNTNFDVQ